VRYTFVDLEYARNLAIQGQDIHEVLGIAEEAEAVTTASPMVIGMGGTAQPIPIDVESTPIIPPGKKVGMTLDNTWTKGELKRVSRLELKVPKPFALKESSCTRPVTRTEPDPTDDLLVTYVFENNATDILATYTTITCDLEIPESLREEARELMAGKQENKLIRTFVAVAAYEYVIEEKTQVRIR
jgi:hypothetical protein